MRGRSPMQALAASPTMVGAITTLIVVVAVFLAYNANNGLPFVPVYKVSVEVPNGSRIVRNNEVRIGGSRVGVVESIELVRQNGGTNGDGTNSQGSSSDAGGPDTGADIAARLNLKLDKTAEPIPQDSFFRVRYKSSFGLKFLEITRGDGPPAPEGFVFDGTNDDPNLLTLGEAQEEPSDSAADGVFIQQTEFDDISNTFDTRTRNGARQNLEGFGNAFAGRGASLNLAIESLNPVLRSLKPVAKTLTARNTRLRRFFPELGDAARIVAPIAEQNAQLFTNMADTFEAFSRDPEALKAAISAGPPALRAGIETLPRQRPFLRSFTQLSRDLRPGVSDLRRTLPTLNDAVEIGTPVLRRTPDMNEDLAAALRALERLLDQSQTKVTLTRLKETFSQARPLAEHVAPAQTVCNYFNYWMTFLPEHLTERDQVGFNQRVAIIEMPSGDISFELQGLTDLPLALQALFTIAGFVDGDEVTVEGEAETPLAGYSGEQANGINKQESGKFDPYHIPILHGPPYAVSGQDGNDCLSGQTGYPIGQLPLPGQPDGNPAIGVPDYPGGGPTTLFYDQQGNRSFIDTRVKNRQP